MVKVIVAMSGGIDSSVAAALLKGHGFSVIGVFMKFWHASNAEIRARKVAKILKIPFYVFNFEKEFKKRIVDYFLKEHKNGNTPNPCVLCNKEIKFGLLLKKALALSADYIATGHYARIIQNTKIKNQNDNSKCKIFKLLRAKDENKDQSYFLWRLNQEQLKHILFPIGDYTKRQVKKMARKFKLPVLDVSESQEICFIRGSVNSFLKKYLKEKPGNIIDTEGKVIGKHFGLWFYTIGQRKGIGLPGGPYYVLDKDFKKNLLIVTKKKKDLYKKKLIAKNVNWIFGKKPKLPIKIMAKIRYRSQLASALIASLNRRAGSWQIKFIKPQRAITPGQSVVFYRVDELRSSPSFAAARLGEEVLGGGIIY